MIFVDTGALIALEDVNDKNRIQRMRQGGILEIIHVSKEIEEESWQVFEEFNKDKMWSFTDCTSKVVMDSLRRILKNPRKHRNIPPKYIKDGTEIGVNQNSLRIKKGLFGNSRCTYFPDKSSK